MITIITIFIALTSLSFAKRCTNNEQYDSGIDRIHLIELFTSEGCSSCPPAEAYINSLKSHKDLFKTFIPISFHVSYWDYLGHKDSFSLSEFTKRQRRYAAEWEKSGVYTPGFVLDGKEWKNFNKKVPTHKGKEIGRLIIKS